MNRCWCMLALLAAAGCGQGSSPASRAPATPVTNEPPQSAVGAVVDGLTGKTAVDAGKRARIQIDKASKQENNAINEAMQ